MLSLIDRLHILVKVLDSCLVRFWLLECIIDGCHLRFNRIPIIVEFLRSTLLRFWLSFFRELIDLVNLVLDLLVLVLKMLLQSVSRTVFHVNDFPNINILDQISVSFSVFDSHTSHRFFVLTIFVKHIT